jgi:hypothetical protein
VALSQELDLDVYWHEDFQDYTLLDGTEDSGIPKGYSLQVALLVMQ